MKTTRKLWSILLALVMVISLFGGISLVSAAEDEITLVPDATIGGETVTLTATGVQEYITVFDLASIGYGSGLEYCLWFDHAGTFSFDKDVTLYYQGSAKVDLTGGEVYSIAEGISGGTWSELYALMDDGNMLMILDQDSPGNFASLAADTPLAEFPGSLNGQPSPAPAPTVPAATDYPDPEGIVRTAKKNADGSVTLAFSSDVHHVGGSLNLQEWIDASGIDYIDSIGFCGDLGAASAATTDLYWSYVGEVMAYVDSEIEAGKIGSAVYTHGNHEWFPTSGGGYKTQFSKYPEVAGRIKQLGEAVRTDDYIIYCFGAGEGASSYSCHFTLEDTAVMEEYLSTAPTDIPIFVLTHYPLHTWIRGSSVRVINYAGDVIDVLNQHPNVVLLWGHNHTEYDDNYYDPKFAGDEIVIDAAGTTRTLNFSYLAAGCTSDEEYTGSKGGSAATMNKGLIVTIGADGGLSFKYATLDGKFMNIASPWMVRFRSILNGNAVFDTQYVENGSTVTAPAAPEFEGYELTGWTTWLDGKEIDFDFAAPITRNMLVTANYARITKPVAEEAARDPAFVYVTIQDEQATAIGKSGTAIALYPVPYVEGMTVGDAFLKVHELEYPEGTEGVSTYNTGYGFWSFGTLWGHKPQNGSLAFDPSQEKCWIDTSAEAVPGASYYALAYDTAWISTSFMAPACTAARVGETITLCAKTFAMDASYNYTAEGFTGDVYCGAGFDDLTDTGIDALEGYFDISFPAPGSYVLVVKGAQGDAVSYVTVSRPVVQVSTQKLTVDGVEQQIDHYNIDGSNYFKLRDLACILNGTPSSFDVSYDAAARAVNITTGKAYTPIDGDMVVGEDKSATAVLSNQTVLVNGASVGFTAFNIDGSNYFKLRDLAAYLGYDVDYDAATRTSQIITK